MSLITYLLMSLEGLVGYAFQQIYRVAYTFIGLKPNNEQRHVMA